MIYNTRKSKHYSIIAFLLSFVVYIASLILEYRYVEYFLNPFVAPVILILNFILMFISFNQENFIITPPKFIIRRRPEDDKNQEPELHYLFTLTAYSGDKDDVNIYIKDIEIELSSNLDVYKVRRGNNQLNCNTIEGNAERGKHTLCAVKDHSDVNTRFNIYLVPNSNEPEDVNKLEIKIGYEKHFWKLKINYLESHTVKSG